MTAQGHSVALEDVYAEFPSPVAGVQCTWQRRTSGGTGPLVVPDGCVDLVWFSDGRFEIAGPDTAARRVQINTDLEIVGVRLATAAARRVVGLPIGELRDQQPAMGTIGGAWRQTVRSLEAQGDACMPDRRGALVALAARAVGRPNDTLVEAAADRIERLPRIKISVLADDLGVSARQLQRRFVDEVGYPPKTFARITRLRRLLSVATTAPDLASAALASGFASQSHMVDDVRALTSMTPVRFLEDRCGWSP